MKNLMIIALLIVQISSGCKKLVEVGTPQNLLTTDKVFSDTTSATAALGNIYAQLERTLEVNYSMYMDMYTDDLNFTSTSTTTLEFLHSTVSASNYTDLNIWENLYSVVYACNDLIGELKITGNVNASSVNTLSNEARFLRAYAYFYLINLYGRVPLILTTDINGNAKAVQTDPSIVYQQIVTDLKTANNGLSADYITSGKVRANKWAAEALLARVYLYQQNWTAAEATTTDIINSELYSLSPALDSVFLAGSSEAILQVWNQNGYVMNAVNLIPSSNTSLPTYPITSSLYAAFESGDLRRSYWIGNSVVPNEGSYYYLNKYKNWDINTTSPEYLMVFRIAEQYLIRAEARAEQGKITGTGGAAEDLNVIRNRAGLLNTDASTQNLMFAAIMQERRVELFGEWGNRFLDLKRSGQLNTVLGAYKTTWQAHAALLPIPLNELTYDPNLTQNQGY